MANGFVWDGDLTILILNSVCSTTKQRQQQIFSPILYIITSVHIYIESKCIGSHQVDLYLQLHRRQHKHCGSYAYKRAIMSNYMPFIMNQHCANAEPPATFVIYIPLIFKDFSSSVGLFVCSVLLKANNNVCFLYGTSQNNAYIVLWIFMHLALPNTLHRDRDSRHDSVILMCILTARNRSYRSMSFCPVLGYVYDLYPYPPVSASVYTLNNEIC